MAEGYSSPKLTQYIGDGFEYLQEHENEFDVIITDSSDPVGRFAQGKLSKYMCYLGSSFKPPPPPPSFSILAMFQVVGD